MTVDAWLALPCFISDNFYFWHTVNSFWRGRAHNFPYYRMPSPLHKIQTHKAASLEQIDRVRQCPAVAEVFFSVGTQLPITIKGMLNCNFLPFIWTSLYRKFRSDASFKILFQRRVCSGGGLKTDVGRHWKTYTSYSRWSHVAETFKL